MKEICYHYQSKDTFIFCVIRKRQKFTKGWSLLRGRPFGRLPSGGRKNYLAVLLFSCWLLVHSISLSSNLCEAITVPLCSGVLLIVGSYNLSPLTKQKGWLHISSRTNERSLRKSLDLSQLQREALLLPNVCTTYYQPTIRNLNRRSEIQFINLKTKPVYSIHNISLNVFRKLSSPGPKP